LAVRQCDSLTGFIGQLDGFRLYGLNGVHDSVADFASAPSAD
jgi:hypothetical protein